jgi:hypothetical protein
VWRVGAMIVRMLRTAECTTLSRGTSVSAVRLHGFTWVIGVNKRKYAW